MTEENMFGFWLTHVIFIYESSLSKYYGVALFPWNLMITNIYKINKIETLLADSAYVCDL